MNLPRIHITPGGVINYTCLLITAIAPYITLGLIGIPLGIVAAAGLAGGLVLTGLVPPERVAGLMRAMDVLLAFPSLLLVATLSADPDPLAMHRPDVPPAAARPARTFARAPHCW